MIRGARLVFGAVPIRPINNLPADVLRVRVRIRTAKPALAYLRFVDRTEEWFLQVDGENWKLFFRRGANGTLKTNGTDPCKQPAVTFGNLVSKKDGTVEMGVLAEGDPLRTILFRRTDDGPVEIQIGKDWIFVSPAMLLIAAKMMVEDFSGN